MPALPPAPGVARVVLELTHLGQQARNVIHFKLDDGTPNINIVELAASVGSWWEQQLKPIVSNDTILTAVTAASLDSGGAPSTIWTPATTAAGTAGSTGMPGNVTIVMSMMTALRGKSFRGRIYHVGLTEPQVSGNQIMGTHLTALLVAYNLLRGIQQTPASSLQPGVLSYYGGGLVRPEPIFTPATIFRSDGIVDSQRRRLPGRGR